mmetsp:Transcript_56010/g.179765  ORF Transcript_56010/g.179765 Transcript_56010/m.179765 type:complete len:210 (+) Transcript_56010:156-785(+)
MLREGVQGALGSLEAAAVAGGRLEQRLQLRRQPLLALRACGQRLLLLLQRGRAPAGGLAEPREVHFRARPQRHGLLQSGLRLLSALEDSRCRFLNLPGRALQDELLLSHGSFELHVLQPRLGRHGFCEQRAAARADLLHSRGHLLEHAVPLRHELRPPLLQVPRLAFGTRQLLAQLGHLRPEALLLSGERVGLILCNLCLLLQEQPLSL